MTSVLVDANVWTQLCDYDGRQAVYHLHKTARAAGVDILVAPPIVFEVMARPPVNAEARAALRERAWIMSRRWWRRVQSDAYIEAGEIFTVIARYRPDWLRSDRQQAALVLMAEDWTRDYQVVPVKAALSLTSGNPALRKRVLATRAGDRVRFPGFWKRLEDDHHFFAQLMRERQDELNEARQSAKSMRAAIHSAPTPPSHPKDWVVVIGRRSIPFWRHWAESSLQDTLRRDTRRRPGNRGLLDFLDPVIDLRAAFGSRNSWSSLWFDEVTAEEVPSHWLRGNALPCQMTMKVTPGTPGDHQITGYLFHADHVITADRDLVRVIEMLAECDPPFRPAEGHQVRQGAGTLEDLIALITRFAGSV